MSFDLVDIVLGALAGAVVAVILVTRTTRRCTCLPPDFRDSELEIHK